MKQRNIRPHINVSLPSRAKRTPPSTAIAVCRWRCARPRDPARWRALLLGTVAVSALYIVAPRPAEAGPQGCVINGTEATCSGNQSGGIQDGVDFLSPPVNTLNINNLTQNIGSLTGGIVDGNAIDWNAVGPINLTSNTGNFIIDARNSGIDLFSQGAGNAITVNHTGDIRTGNGAFARAIDAAAIGNGIDSGAVSVTMTGNIFGGQGIVILSRTAGGNAGATTIVYTGNNTGGLAAESDASNGGSSGPVSITSNGNLGGFGVSATSRAGGGTAGSVTVSSTGNIVSSFTGISAESESSQGASSAVTVTSSGNITAGGAGIVASSVGATQGNIQVNINGGAVRGGVVGVQIVGGAANTLTVASGASLSSLNGLAIAAAGNGGDDTVNNSGVITGDVGLGAGANAFNNLAGGLFNAGTLLFLGNGSALTNSGTFAPGGVGAAPITTTLTGSFIQDPGGRYAVDVSGAAADRVNVSGTAILSGTVLPTVRGLILTSPKQQFTILSAAGGATNNGITVRDTLTADFELLFPNANDMVLQVAANFAPVGVPLTPNQRVTAAHLQSALNAGGGNLGSLFGFLASFLDGKAFAAALDRLHPEPYLAQVQSTWLASLGFADGLMSCPTAASADANTFLAEGQCTWMRMGARQLSVDRTSENIGFNDKSWGGSGGAQFALAPNWFGSIAFGYDNSTIKVDDRASITGDIFHAGIGAKYVHGNWQIAGALTGGHASYNTTRFAVIPGVSADGDGSLSFLSGRVRMAYVFGGDAAYVKPLVDFDATGIRRSGIRETGAGPVGLNVRGQTDTLFSVAPAVEVGGQFAYAGGNLLRPFLRAGVRFFSESDLKATASFIGSPDAAPAFTVTTPVDRWMGEASAGLEMLREERYDARISYEGRFGERSTQHGGNVKLRAKF